MTLHTRHLDCTVPNNLPVDSNYSRFPHLGAVLNVVSHDILFDVIFSNPTASAEAVAETVAALVKETILAEWHGAIGAACRCGERVAKEIRARYVARLSEYKVTREQAIAYMNAFTVRMKADLDAFRS